jgi:hypothetical protein
MRLYQRQVIWLANYTLCGTTAPALKAHPSVNMLAETSGRDVTEVVGSILSYRRTHPRAPFSVPQDD